MNSSNRHDEATMDWLLDAYWERHIAGAPATTADRALDPALAATVRHLHAHDDAPGPDRAFVRRLRETSPCRRPRRSPCRSGRLTQ